MTASAPVAASPRGPLWRVGRRPDPWAWVPWEYAGSNRWDDIHGVFRSIYAAESPYACYVELLAQFRPDPDLVFAMSAIVVDPADQDGHPTARAGEVPRAWIEDHLLTSALVAGVFCDVTTAPTIAALRPHFTGTAAALGLSDFDAAALKSARPRTLTQEVASHIYRLRRTSRGALFDGVRFGSRHGDELPLWAIFERPGDEPRSALVTVQTEAEIDPSGPELSRALALHGLSWNPREWAPRRRRRSY